MGMLLILSVLAQDDWNTQVPKEINTMRKRLHCEVWSGKQKTSKSKMSQIQLTNFTVVLFDKALKFIT